MNNAQPAFGSNVGAPGRIDASTKLAGLVGGNVLFNDNQVLLAPKGTDNARIPSAVTILTLDDVSKQGNQCDCRLTNQPLTTNALVLAWSLRAEGNRYKERFDMNGISAFTLALMNNTTNNQGTRCFVIMGMPSLTINSPNSSLVDFNARDFCERIKDMFAGNM